MDLQLVGAAYEARSVTASNQRCINLYPEENPKSSQSPAPYTHYPTPGLGLLISVSGAQGNRCTYTASNGDLYRVIGTSVYYVDPNFNEILLGTIGSASTPVSMQDNGLVILVVDGSSYGYAINMATRDFGAVSSTNFYGGTSVCYLDTFFLLNRPGTNQFYISEALVTYAMLIAGTAFDALDIAAKVGYPDPISNIRVVQGYVWLVGTRSTEVWYNSGNALFPFERLPGVNVIQHGTAATYSLCSQDLFPYFITNNEQGKGIIIKGENYQIKRISTHAIENALAEYETISDCTTYTYQQLGHTFIVFDFPSANASWAFDEASELWHERAYTDNDGNLNRSRVNCIANAYEKIVAGDWQNGNLYELSPDIYTDNGQPISRIRSWPLLISSAKRISYNAFIADMEVGNDDGSIDESDTDNPPVVSLRYSINRGKTWGTRMEQSLGAAGEYNTCVQFQRIGIGRYMVFELSWSAPIETALNEAFITDQMATT